MAHFLQQVLPRPTHFNFARGVVVHWASKTPPFQAMYWVSQDLASTRQLNYSHFSNESHRIAALFKTLDVQPGQTVLVILPRIPEWYVLFQSIRSHCPNVKPVIQIDGSSFPAGTIDFRKAMSKIPKNARVETRNSKAEEPSITYFTSGTSGPPKMVRHNQISYSE
jgi:medium-chain acyl-CoA synthetase